MTLNTFQGIGKDRLHASFLAFLLCARNTFTTLVRNRGVFHELQQHISAKIARKRELQTRKLLTLGKY